MRKSNTRGAQGNGTIRQRKNGLWEARFSVGRDPATGKQKQKSIYGKTQDEVRRKLKEATSKVDSGIYTDSGQNLTVAAWFTVWAREYIGNVKEGTEAAYKHHISRHIIPNIGAVKLSKLSPHHIQTLYNDLQRKNGLSPKTIKNLHGVINRALNQASDLDYIPKNPARKVTLPRAERKDIQPLTEAETKKLLSAVRGTKDETLFNLALFTGMRISEIIGLTWDCIDFEKGTITINKQLIRERKKGGAFYFGTPKNDRPRTIAPALVIIQLLHQRRKEQAEQRLKAGEIWDDTFKGLVFTDEIGGHLYPNAITRRYVKYLEKAGIKSRRFHDLRHTYAVTSLLAGDDPKTLQENLGHHTAAFTLEMYAHVTDDMKKASAARMQNYILNLMK